MPRKSLWIATISLKPRPNRVLPLTPPGGLLGAESMTIRRQALHLCGPVLEFASLPLTLSVVAALANLSSRAELPGAELVHHMRPIELALLVLAILSAVTLAWWRYHCRDIYSPRRIGRRI